MTSSFHFDSLTGEIIWTTPAGPCPLREEAVQHMLGLFEWAAIRANDMAEYRELRRKFNDLADAVLAQARWSKAKAQTSVKGFSKAGDQVAEIVSEMRRGM